MERKRFDMTPELFIEVGTDRFHSAKVGPLTVPEAFSLLRFASPEDAYRASVNQDVPGGGRAAELLGEAVYEWNSVWEEEEGHHHVSSFDWIGISMRAKCDEVDVWCNKLAGEKGICTVYVDQDAIEGEARVCALAALEALAPVRLPGGSRK